MLALPAAPAAAQSFAEDAQAAAAKGPVTLNDIPAIKKFLGFFKAKKLGTLKLNGVKYDGGVGSDEAIASQAMGREITVSQKVRAIQQKAELQKELEAREKIEGIKCRSS